MIASERVLKAVYARLAGDGTLVGLLGTGNRIHEQVAPADTATPFVVLDVPAAVDLTAVGGARIWEDTLVSATVRGRGLTSTIVPIADRIDTLLQNYAVVVDAVEVGKLTRERGVRLPPEVENGVRYPAIYQEYRSQAST
jgi:hypothetical protein